MFTPFRFTVFLCVGLVVATSGKAQAAEGKKRSSRYLTVATYNVQGLMDKHDDPYTFDETLPTKSGRAVKQIAKTIRSLDADIVALQEVENEPVLRALVERFLGSLNYRYVVVVPTNSRYGMNLGVLSRKPVVRVTSHRFMRLPLPRGTSPRRFARDLLQVSVQVTRENHLDLFVAHFKSRYDSAGDPQSNRWRQAEAAATAGVIRRLLSVSGQPGWVVLAGDLNATPESPTLDLLLESEDRPGLVDVHAHLPAVDRITYLHRPHRTTVDYLLASSPLAQRVVPESADTLAGAELSGGSDHAPVVVTFDIGHRR